MRELEYDLIKIYKKCRLEGTLSEGEAKGQRDTYIRILSDLRKEEDRNGRPFDVKQRRCEDFKMTLLLHGWSPEDMPLMEKFFLAAEDLADGPAKDEAMFMVRSLAEFRPDTFARKSLMIADAAKLWEAFNEPYKTELEELFAEANMRKPALGEFPGDERLHKEFKKTGEINAFYVSKIHNAPEAERERRRRLQDLGYSHNSLRTEEYKRNLRNKGTYVLPELKQEELNQHERNKSQARFKLKTSQRNAMKQIFGEKIYDEIDSAYKAQSVQERTVKLNNARGNRQLEAGANVLELDFAGSGFAQARKEHHGLVGKYKDNGRGKGNLGDVLNAQYGRLVNKVGDREVPNGHYLRMKKKNENGSTKYRYTFPGPSAEGKGQLDHGPYSITKNTDLALDVVKDFLKPLMDEHMLHKNDPGYRMKPVHINLYGHSRGAVTASEVLFEVHDWLKSQKGFEDFADNVFFDLLQRDPVPGPDVADERRRHPDINDIPNVTSTTIYTTLADEDYFGLLFRPQRMRGQGRIIIGTMPHGTGTEGADLSQMDVEGDGMAHQYGFYNSENKEYYRGSGINDLPEGVYLTDEKRNLIRVTRYSQVDKLINIVNPDDGYMDNQQERQLNLRETVKNWFIDNPDLVVYHSADERKQDLADLQTIRERFVRKGFIIAMEPLQKLLKEEEKVFYDQKADEETKRLKREELLKAMNEFISGYRSNFVNKYDEKNEKEYTYNKQFNDLCDLYVILQKEENYRRKLIKEKAAYHRAADEAGFMLRYAGDMGVFAKRAALEIEGWPQGEKTEAERLINLTQQLSGTGMNDTPATLTERNAALTEFIKKHRGPGRRAWSQDPALDAKMDKLAEEMFEYARSMDIVDTGLLTEQKIRNISLKAALEEKFAAMDNAVHDADRAEAKDIAKKHENELKAACDKARGMYERMMGFNVDPERDSAEFTAMKEALKKVSGLDAGACPADIMTAMNDLSVSSRNYINKIDIKGGGHSFFGKKGIQRLSLARELKSFAHEALQKGLSPELSATKGLDLQQGVMSIDVGEKKVKLRQEGDFTVVEDMPKKRNGIKLDKMIEQERRSVGGAEKKDHKRNKPDPEVPVRSKTDKDLLKAKNIIKENKP